MFANPSPNYLEKGCQCLNDGNRKEAIMYWEKCFEPSLFNSACNDSHSAFFANRQTGQDNDFLLRSPYQSDSEPASNPGQLENQILANSKQITDNRVDRFQPLIDQIYSLSAYRSLYDPESGDPISRLLRYLKRSKEHAPVIGYVLGRTLVSFLLGKSDILDDVDTVIPVPLSCATREHRGYNQTELLAEPFQSLLGIPVMSDVLCKIRDTADLRYLPASRRERELRGVFEVKDPDQIEQKNILLIDDVTTYGTTLKECARALRKHTPENIYAATIAKSESSTAAQRKKPREIDMFAVVQEAPTGYGPSLTYIFDMLQSFVQDYSLEYISDHKA